MTQIRYTITSKKFAGNLVFGLTGDVFTLVENNTDMNSEQMRWVMGFLAQGNDLKKLAQRVVGTLEVIPTDLSFEAFWNSYKWKRNRYRSEPLWKKMTDAERVECLQNIPKYHHWLKQNPSVAMMNPDTYLLKQEYKTDWKDLKRPN